MRLQNLGYAVTAHRAQGITVDTAHVVVTSSTTRPNLYVAMTRGRASNTAYVALDHPDESHTPPEPDACARTVLCGVMANVGDGLSATQTIDTETAAYTSIRRLAAELDTIAADAQRPRFEGILARSGLTRDQWKAVITSSAFGPLAAAMRRAEAYRHDLERLMPGIVAQHDLGDAHDIAAVLRTRLENSATGWPRGIRTGPHLVVGLIPEPRGPMAATERQAIDDRIALIEARAKALLENALYCRAPWIEHLGEPPNDALARIRWLAAAATVAAYRDRYRIVTDLPVEVSACGNAQRADRALALAATRAAMDSAREARPTPLRSNVGPMAAPDRRRTHAVPQA